LTDPVVLEDPDGGRVAVYGIPYLEPRQAGQDWGVTADHVAVTTEAVRRVRADVEERFGPGNPDGDDGGTAVIVMAHLFAAGGAGSDSERDIGATAPVEAEDAPDASALVGTLGQVPVTVFDGIDYTALGHLHGRQAMAPTVRYSGSPLPYSFSEANHTKGGLLVTTAGGKLTGVETVDWSAGRKLAVLRGRIDNLLLDPEFAWAENRWCQVTVTDPVRPPQAYQRLKERFDGLLNFILEPEGGSGRAPSTYAARLAAAKTDLQVCTGFVDHVRQRPVSREEADLLRLALEETRSGGAA
jgi:exonuclease SbcD